MVSAVVSPALLATLLLWHHIIVSPVASQGSMPATELNREYDTSCKNYAYTQTIDASAAGAYQWFTSQDTRQAGLTNVGNTARLRVAMDRFLRGGNLSVAFVGGSISAGNGAYDGYPLSLWLKDIIAKSYGGNAVKDRVQVQTAAVAGTWSSYMSLCYYIHVPTTVDVVFVDYAINDPDALDGMNINNPPRKYFERLLRTLMNYPKKPAVVLLNAYSWFKTNGTFHTVVERDFHEFAMYYGIPSLSVKACCWRLMHEGAEGYQVHGVRANDAGQLRPEAEDAPLRGKLFYWDKVHPDGLTGHRVMGELAAQLLLDVGASLKHMPISAGDAQTLSEPILSPMILGNFEQTSNMCLIGDAMQSAAVSHEGWSWNNEGTHPDRPKWGYVSTTPGTTLSIRVNTTIPGVAKDAYASFSLAYLKSYESMGMFSVGCSGACMCAGMEVDSHQLERSSQLFMLQQMVSQAEDCLITITNLEKTSSGGHKVKIAGVVVYEFHPNYLAASAAVVDLVQSMLATTKLVEEMRANATIKAPQQAVA